MISRSEEAILIIWPKRGHLHTLLLLSSNRQLKNGLQTFYDGYDMMIFISVKCYGIPQRSCAEPVTRILLGNS